MATTYTGFNETVLMKDSLGALKAALISINAFSFKAETKSMLKGEVVKVPIRGAATAATRVLGADGESGGASATASVTLLDPIASQWEAVDGRDPLTAFMDRAIEHSYAVAKAYLDAALAYFTAANYGDLATDKLVVPVSEFGMADIAQLAKKADDKGVSERGRSLILNSSYAWQAVGDSTLGLIIATGGSKSFETGILPPLGGMQTFKYSALPTNSQNLAGIVCDTSALACAMAPVLPVSIGGESSAEFNQILSDPESGVVMSYRRWRDSGKGITYGRFEVMPGFAKCNAAAIRLLSA
jgi:hypothetical protein